MPRPDSSPESSLTRTHDNTVTIDDTASQIIQSITYVTDSLHITDGQPSVPPATIDVEDHVFKITLKAGQKGSEAVADSFDSACGGASKEYAPSGGGGTPTELHFYFAVTIQFTSGGVATVYLAQGTTRRRTTGGLAAIRSSATTRPGWSTRPATRCSRCPSPETTRHSS